MNKSKIIPFIISLALLCAVIGFSLPKNNNSVNKSNSTSNKAKQVSSINVKGKDSQEMRAIWIGYMTLDMSDTDRSEQAFKDKFDSIVKKSKESGFNTLIVQVRPFSDALYKSKIFPSSHIVTQTQGDKLTYDPLKYMCKAAHDNEMQIHAWVNPYRISLTETPKIMSKENPYVKNNDLGVKWENSLYYNPALKEVRSLIVDGVKEIVENYDVDGIQFDDYFYPTENADFDKTQYNSYKKSMKNKDSILSLEQWRISNVNMLIADTYRTVHNIKSDAVFGISPQGNIKNNKNLYADVYSWCKEKGYIDYICPQIYFSLDNPALSYETSLKEWLSIDMHDSLNFYVGLAGYKAGSDSDEGTWLDNDDILMQEIEILRKNKTQGFMLYSYESLIGKESANEIKNVVKLLTDES